jgi:hypothetical protein
MGHNHFRQTNPTMLASYKKTRTNSTYISFSFSFPLGQQASDLIFSFHTGLCQTIEWVTETVVALFLHVIFLSFLFD